MTGRRAWLRRSLARGLRKVASAVSAEPAASGAAPAPVAVAPAPEPAPARFEPAPAQEPVEEHAAEPVEPADQEVTEPADQDVAPEPLIRGDMPISEVLALDPRIGPLLEERYHLACARCQVAPVETFEEGMGNYDLNAVEVARVLEQALG